MNQARQAAQEIVDTHIPERSLAVKAFTARIEQAAREIHAPLLEKVRELAYIVNGIAEAGGISGSGGKRLQEMARELLALLGEEK